MKPKAISFTPDVLKAKLRTLEEHGICMTRRPVRRDWIESLGDPDCWEAASNGTFRAFDHLANEMRHFVGPFGAVGDSLWIRERARVLEFAHGASGPMVRLAYEVDDTISHWLPYPPRLRHPVVGLCVPNGVHREGARHFLEVVEVRAERVADISEQDARLEGIEGPSQFVRTSFFALYDSIYGAGAHSRDWCWVYTLKRAAP